MTSFFDPYDYTSNSLPANADRSNILEDLLKRFLALLGITTDQVAEKIGRIIFQDSFIDPNSIVNNTSPVIVSWQGQVWVKPPGGSQAYPITQSATGLIQRINATLPNPSTGEIKLLNQDNNLEITDNVPGHTVNINATALKNALNAAIADIASNTADIASNKSNIAANTANLSNKVSSVSPGDSSVNIGGSAVAPTIAVVPTALSPSLVSTDANNTIKVGTDGKLLSVAGGHSGTLDTINNVAEVNNNIDFESSDNSIGFSSNQAGKIDAKVAQNNLISSQANNILGLGTDNKLYASASGAGGGVQKIQGITPNALDGNINFVSSDSSVTINPDQSNYQIDLKSVGGGSAGVGIPRSVYYDDTFTGGDGSYDKPYDTIQTACLQAVTLANSQSLRYTVRAKDGSSLDVVSSPFTLGSGSENPFLIDIDMPFSNLKFELTLDCSKATGKDARFSIKAYQVEDFNLIVDNVQSRIENPTADREPPLFVDLQVEKKVCRNDVPSFVCDLSSIPANHELVNSDIVYNEEIEELIENDISTSPSQVSNIQFKLRPDLRNSNLRYQGNLKEIDQETNLDPSHQKQLYCDFEIVGGGGTIDHTSNTRFYIEGLVDKNGGNVYQYSSNAQEIDIQTATSIIASDSQFDVSAIGRLSTDTVIVKDTLQLPVSTTSQGQFNGVGEMRFDRSTNALQYVDNSSTVRSLVPSNNPFQALGEFSTYFREKKLRTPALVFNDSFEMSDKHNTMSFLPSDISCVYKTIVDYDGQGNDLAASLLMDAWNPATLNQFGGFCFFKLGDITSFSFSSATVNNVVEHTVTFTSTLTIDLSAEVIPGSVLSFIDPANNLREFSIIISEITNVSTAYTIKGFSNVVASAQTIPETDCRNYTVAELSASITELYFGTRLSFTYDLNRLTAEVKSKTYPIYYPVFIEGKKIGRKLITLYPFCPQMSEIKAGGRDASCSFTKEKISKLLIDLFVSKTGETVNNVMYNILQIPILAPLVNDALNSVGGGRNIWECEISCQGNYFEAQLFYSPTVNAPQNIFQGGKVFGTDAEYGVATTGFLAQSNIFSASFLQDEACIDKLFVDIVGFTDPLSFRSDALANEPVAGGDIQNIDMLASSNNVATVPYSKIKPLNLQATNSYIGLGIRFIRTIGTTGQATVFPSKYSGFLSAGEYVYLKEKAFSDVRVPAVKSANLTTTDTTVVKGIVME